jgi:amino acid transporter
MSRPDVRRETTAPPSETVVRGRPGGLGTFGGVFTPSILTILGVIMYLRFGWVVGNVGLLGTLIIVTLSTSITFLTGLSIAAIATDQRVRIGGAYYMISRSLGIEAGGAVGIPLYLAQGLSVALYTVGFAESVVDAFPSLDQRMIGVVTTVAVAALALTSARTAIRAQYVIMAAIAVSLVSFVLGRPLEGTTIEMWGAHSSVSEPFWVVFAVFFPAVTGIMAGVNMSGDLEDPGRSIPRGTFAAIGTGFVIYMGLPILLASRADAMTLLEDPLIMRRIAWWGDAILLGVWGATLSSAVGSILGAPRVLQALARDGVLPRPLQFLGRGSGPDDSPRIGTVATLVVALVAVWFGDLNLIAPVLTMFFLTTYGVLNVAAGVERFLGSPSFRPEFKVHWAFSMLGAAGCVAVMFLVNPVATVIAVLFVSGIFVWLERRGLEATWGDVRRGLWMALARAGILRLRTDTDPRNWRPHFLVLSGAPTRRWHLVELADAWSHQRGLMTVSTVLPPEKVAADRKATLELSIREYLGKRGIQALVRVISAPDPFEGSERLVEAYGLGALAPNTILLGASERDDHRRRYCTMVRRFWESRRNVIIVRAGMGQAFGSRSRIDLWWGGLQGNGALLLILGYLLRTSLPWRGAEVRLKMVVPTRDAATEALPNLNRIISETRTGVRPEVIASEKRSFEEILVESSAGADLVLLGMAAPNTVEGGEEGYAKYYDTLMRRATALPTTAYVLASEGIAFREVLFRGSGAAQ